MHIADHPLQFEPHSCAVSGRNDGVIVDLNVHTAGFDQRLYLKDGVIEQAARLIGMLPKAEADELRARCAELEAEVEANAPKAIAWDALSNATHEIEATPKEAVAA